MTIIVGYKDAKTGNVYIAGDTVSVGGLDKLHRNDGKVFINNGILYGFTTSYRLGQILQYHSTPVESELREKDTFAYVVTCLMPMWRKILSEHAFTKTESGVDTGGDFIVGLEDRLFRICSDFQVAEPKDNFCAVGCGAEYALGSLFSMKIQGFDSFKPEEIMQEACSAAVYFSAGCGGDITWVGSDNGKD